MTRVKLKQLVKKIIINQFFEDEEEYESYKPHIKFLGYGIIYYVTIMTLLNMVVV